MTAATATAEAEAVEEFLRKCEASGDEAYGAFRSVLEKLEDPSSRTQARVFLSDLQKRVNDSDECLNKYHFRIQDVVLDQYEGYQGRKKLTMMVIPSIFIPEDWSFTFYEGLNRHPDSILKDKTVAELGCGNGWITIAIAEKWLPSKVYGLDINPRAIRISWINLYLNALDEKGQPIYDAEKKTLLDRVEFHESDLLAYCRDHDIQLERIVGCIPQILNPNPDAMSKIITENASEEFLYSLSNYCALQGFVEDQFGLGLIARAVEEGIGVIKPSGIMIFNMGGRPGQGVYISALVEIEKNSPHRFEFFMGLSGDLPICARTAWAYGKAGGRISHALSVYSCQLHQPNQVKKIFKFLKNGFHEISSSLDLSFEDDSVADEKIPFLAYLASVLKERSFFPYEPPAGSKRFRNLIADFMKKYHHIPLNADGTDTENSSEHELTVIEAPRQSDLMVELIKKLKPQVVISGIGDFEAVTSSAFVHLLDVTREVGSRLFLDISDHFELSSLPSSNGVLKYLAGNVLPSHAAVICGLVKNQVYSDLEVAFLISEEEAIFKALSKTVEVLEGTTALISQNYYGCLFHELLAFQLAERHTHKERDCEKAKSTEMIGFSRSAISVLNSAELSITETPNSGLIHMDVDQSFLPIPSLVKAAIFESFARQNMSESEIDVTPSIQQYIKSNFGFPIDINAEFIYADCSQSLFNKLVLCCILEGGTLCFPAGSNGNYVSAARFLKANIVNIPTESEVGFKMTEKTLVTILETVKKPWVYISGPTINPTGLLYSNKEIENILTVCAKYGARVVIDTAFSGLEFNYEGWGGWDLEGCLSKLYSSTNSSFNVSLLGGLSLKMLTGALKFGFLVLNHPQLVDAFSSFPGLSKPHSTVRYAIKKLLGLRERKARDLMNAVAEHIRNLESRSKRLKEALENCGWEAVQSCGGVSMVAKPSAYLNKTVKISRHSSGSGEKTATEQIKLDDSNIREAIVKATGLCINSGSWTGIPGYCRFTIALEESEFERALDCIAKFESIVHVVN
ncbi:methionine S-methyltransferase [Citrus sinensis]|nr:methionine S-methyltransferase [Citrus sinensis]